MLGGRYEILQTVGEGGMGAVYKAEDRELGRTVALKVIRPELSSNPDILQRFKQEILLASKVTDRNIIRIYDLGDAEGAKFITMEFVEGEDLRHLLRRQGKLPAAEGVDIMEQAVSGLRAAHRLGIIHRDLKPGNIMRATDGRVLVMDFGLARSMEGDGMTRTGTMLGTMEYMSPEQAQAKDLDARSDIFTVGLILYELLTGIMPYRAESAIASLLKRTQQRAIPVSDVDKNVPGALSNVVSKCLERDPALRYQSADDLLNDLWAWQGKSGGTTRVSASSTQLWMNRLREVPWLQVVAVLVLLGVFVGAVWYVGRGKPVAQKAHEPVSVLIADFQNNTSDSLFDGALEPTFNLALEGASFITAYSRGDAYKTAEELNPGSHHMDESLARLVAQRQGVHIVVSGSVAKTGAGYKVLCKVIDGITGKVLSTEVSEASDKSGILLAVAALASKVRTDLGDTTPESSKLAEAETFTSGSLEAAHEYAEAQEARYSGKTDEAIKGFRRAIEFDPKFGSAYAALAAQYWNQGNQAEAMNYYKKALEHIDRMTDREKYRARGGYYLAVSDGDKAVEEFSALVRQYPADSMGLSALAHAYYLRHDMSHAVEASRRAMEIYPKNLVYHNNEALYALFAGDYVTAEGAAQSVLAIDPSYEDALITMALTETAKGNFEKATEYWDKIGSLRATGPSSAANGLADLALYRSDPAQAIAALEKGIAADLAAKSQVAAAKKYVVLAEAYIMLGKKAEAEQSVNRAVAMSKADVLFPAARAYVMAAEFGKATALASELLKQLDDAPQAFGKLIEGDIQLARGKPRPAIQLFQDSKRLSDSWLARFDLARAYLEAGAYPDANSELETCLNRRGEATDIYIDEQQTFRYFPQAYYYLGRTLEGLKSNGAADAYSKFLAMKVQNAHDPMVDDARKRLTKMAKM
jgi:tetratricopeptide (TPR) repeat protein/predicted Ser/Thr protein kinase